MNKEFQKGVEYERKRREISFYLFLGWACIIMSPIWFFFSVWDFPTRLKGSIILMVIGILGLYLGYKR